ncbi:hypothetical protein BY458DRAFT_439594 [Sporodiniella umbellata]|nr:hypothetical protein BY458DRAFT_439594 [Sporodiniella umbellata]
MTHDHSKKRMVESMKSKEDACSKKTKSKKNLPKEEQFDYIQKLMDTVHKDSNKRFMLCTSWYRSFQIHCKNKSGTLHSIDNSSLLDEKMNPKEDLLNGKDFISLPEIAWSCLIEWYGIKGKSHILVDIQYRFYIYQLHEKAKQHRAFCLHNKSTIQDLYEAIVAALKMTTPITHVWLLDQAIESNRFVSENLLNSISKKEIDPSVLPLYSFLNEHLPKNQDHSHYLVIKSDFQSQPILNEPRGLKNLGNTCYMNSAIQCLINTELLTKWFLSGMYKEDINVSNPLGFRGELVNAYCELVQSLSGSNKATVSPFMFKKIFEKFHAHFRGYEQQDSQEFLLFLLDGLHEDMNRISKKPYIEFRDYEDETQSNEIAQLFWKYHKSRNDSIIVDLFHGQLKSKQTRFTLYINRNETVRNLIQEICRKLEIPEHIVIVQTAKQMVYKVLKENEHISEIPLLENLYAHEVPSFVKTNNSCVLFPVYHFLVDQDNDYQKKLGFPFLIALNGPTDIRKLIVLLIQKFTNKNFENLDSTTFSLQLFDSKNSTMDCFPTLRSLEDIRLLLSENIASVQKGQGIIIKWRMSGAFDIFGYVLKSPTEKVVNTELWKKYVALPTSHPNEKDLDLDCCIQEFMKEERLNSKNLWYCHNCKSYQKATKKFDIWKLPEIIVFHFKRFSQSKVWGSKLNTYIDFPISGLDMSEYIRGPKDESSIYDLYAIDNHYGGLEGGHYTAYALNTQDRTWYSFDDLSVTKVPHGEIKTNAAYLLFYRRRRDIVSQQPTHERD